MDVYRKEGGTVIDYGLGNEESREKVNRMKAEERVNLDHQSIKV